MRNTELLSNGSDVPSLSGLDNKSKNGTII